MLHDLPYRDLLRPSAAILASLPSPRERGVCVSGKCSLQKSVSFVSRLIRIRETVHSLTQQDGNSRAHPATREKMEHRGAKTGLTQRGRSSWRADTSGGSLLTPEANEPFLFILAFPCLFSSSDSADARDQTQAGGVSRIALRGNQGVNERSAYTRRTHNSEIPSLQTSPNPLRDRSSLPSQSATCCALQTVYPGPQTYSPTAP